MHVEVQRASEALDDRHASGASVDYPAANRAPTLEAKDGAEEDPQHCAGELVIPRASPPEPEGKCEDPLAMTYSRQNVIDEVGGARAHATSRAAQANAATFARERDESFGSTPTAAEAREAVR